MHPFRGKACLAALMLAAPVAQAETTFTPNVFFGFEFVLHPLGIKWACGGDPTADLRRIEDLLEAFPKDAKTADLARAVELTLANSTQDGGIETFTGRALSAAQEDALCAHALPLTMDIVTPESLATGDDSGMSPEQRRAWRAFFLFVEKLPAP